VKKGLPAPLFASLLVTLLVLGSAFFYSRSIQDWLMTRQHHKEAFGKAKWGMSVAQVEKAQGVKLDPPTDQHRYYTPVNGLESRYIVLKQADLTFLGRSAEAHYVFFDDRLYACHLTVKDRNPQVLDRDVQAYLIGRFGTVNTPVSDGSSLRMIWHLREVIVNYWLLKNSLSLTSPYEAIFGVVYQPIERSISS